MAREQTKQEVVRMVPDITEAERFGRWEAGRLPGLPKT